MFMLFWQLSWVVLMCWCSCWSSALPPRFLCMNLLTDLLQNPISLVQIAPGKLFVAERDGKIQMVHTTDRMSQPEVALDLSDKVFTKADHLGLLSIALHPKFRSNGYIFLMYSADTDDREFHHRQLISRFTLSSTNATEIDKFSERVILEIYQSSPTGGQIWFGSEDRVLYIAVGDGSRARRRRFDRGSFNGKILRINVDVDGHDVPYKIPDDNPFAHQPSTLLPEVFAYGLINPWRCSEDQRKETRKGTAQTRIVCIDVGAKFSDFNIIQKGGMYGWLDEAFSPCHDLDSCRNTTKLKSEFKLPLCRYLGVAVGGVVYPPWNAYLFADYMRRSLHYLRPTHSGSAWLRGPVEVIDNGTTCGRDQRSMAHQTILNLQQTSDKDLFVLTVSSDQTSEEPNGHLYRISSPKQNVQNHKQARSRQIALTYAGCWIFTALFAVLVISDTKFFF